MLNDGEKSPAPAAARRRRAHAGQLDEAGIKLSDQAAARVVHYYDTSIIPNSPLRTRLSADYHVVTAPRAAHI